MYAICRTGQYAGKTFFRLLSVWPTFHEAMIEFQAQFSSEPGRRWVDHAPERRFEFRCPRTRDAFVLMDLEEANKFRTDL
jgi:hypothetical protein